MKKYPMEHWENIEHEKVNLKQGFRLMPEDMQELMEADERKKYENKQNERK